jgi:cell division protein FtsB
LLKSNILNGSIIRANGKETAQGIPKESSGFRLNLSLVMVMVLIAVVAIIGALYFTQTSSLQAQNTALTNERNALASNYSQLSSQYNALLGQKENLQQQYNSLTSEHVLLQGQYESLLDIIALQNSTTLEENAMVVVPEGGSISIELSFEYIGYIEIQFSSPSLLHFTITYSDYGTESRVPADGSSAEGQIRLPVLLGSNVLKIYNDGVGSALVTYTLVYVS